MINFLERALEQRENEDGEEREVTALPPEGHFFGKGPDLSRALPAAAPGHEGEMVFETGTGRGGGRGPEGLPNSLRSADGEALLSEEGRVRSLSGKEGETGGEWASEARPYGSPGEGELPRGRAAVSIWSGRREREMVLLDEVRRAERAVSFVQGPRRNGTLTLPEAAEGETAGLTVETLDRAAERDARRYDGGFSMY